MTGRRRLLVSLFVLACGGEGPVVAQALFSSTDDVDRVRSSVTFDTLWAFGGPADTVLASPIMPRADGAQGVVFFDVLNQAAYRIGSDGELLWSWGTKGEGPGELANVQALDVAPDGSVVLVDSGNLRVVRLSADGHLLGEARALGEGMVHSVAALSGGRLAVHSMRPLLAMWDGDDEDVAVVPAKLGEPHVLQHQGRTARWGNDGWVFGFLVGNGWMKFRGTELLGVFPYVEHVDFPEVREVSGPLGGRSSHMMRRPVRAGVSLSVVADTLFVLFSGKTPGRGRLLDKFDVQSGEYLETEVLPHFANEAVVDGNRVFTIEAWDVFPRIVALARRAPPAP